MEHSLKNQEYKSPFLENRFRWRKWAKDPEGDTGEELINFVNNELFPYLKGLATKAAFPDRGRVVWFYFRRCIQLYEIGQYSYDR